MITVGIVFALLQIAIYVVHNRRLDQGKYVTKDGKEPMRYTI